MKSKIASLLSILVCMVALVPAAISQQGAGASPTPPSLSLNPNGVRVYIRAGLKSHPPGRHDYPQFLADWSKFLTEHGAVVTGSLHAPSAAELANIDVLIIFKGDAGFMTPTEKADLEGYVKRGGGIVLLHDSLCGPDPAYFATLVGAGKKHGEVNYTNPAVVPYTIVDKSSPIMQGMSDLVLFDEAFYKMTWAKDPEIHVLATAVIADTPAGHAGAGTSVPQIWTYEHTLPGGQPARSFVWMQGDNYSSFQNYQIQQMLLRGIAWAGKRPVNELVDFVPPPPRTPGGGRGTNPPAER